ncbi:MAG: pyruvate synthase [Candidatus Aenigmatarchaeota archaeon]|nr:MAG: pyruvate synthase [Candidatus Aenigmarchaeota archaeon]
MVKTLLDGNSAAAWGGRLARVEVVPNFPVTPQTELIETFAKWKSEGSWKGEFVPVESEHSVMSAAIAASAAGARVFTGTSSQGLMLMHEMMYVASGMRLPVVMINVSRGLSAPITLWPDHNDILDLRDSGWIVFFCETNQEVLDTVIQSFKVCEDNRVLLPAVINMDGFIQSYTREPVEIPSQKLVDRFLPKRKADVVLNVKKPMALGVGVMKEYTYFRQQIYLAHRNALRIINDVHKEWWKIFKRRYGLLESFMMKDAQAALITIGSNTTIAKAAVLALRKKGYKIGLVRIRVYRPFPKNELKKALSHVKAVGVVDQNLSPGYGGILYPEVRDALYGLNIPVSSFIISLGGKHISQEEFEEICLNVLKTIKTKKECFFWQDFR